MAPPLLIVDVGRCAYGPALALQEQFVARRRADEEGDALLLVEHDPVYTLGRHANEANILSSREDLARAGIEVFQTGRGGDVTFHGPGQWVGYPILKLDTQRGGVSWYVNNLEEALIRVLSEFNIEGSRNSANRGVWVGERKIAAIGVRVSRQVTMHGFALNVTTDLRYYAGIVPCGLPDKGVVSMHLLNPVVTMTSVKASIIRRFKEVFGYA